MAKARANGEIGRLENEIQKLEKSKRDLLERLEQLSSLLDNLPGMAFRCLYDEELTFEFASRGSVDILGYDPSEITQGVAFRQLVNAEDQVRNKKMLAAISPENSHYQMVYRMRAAWGEERWIQEQGAAVFSDEGRLTAIEGLLTDITAQKLEEIKLREENLRLRSSMKERYRLGAIIGKSAPMQKVYDRILKAAATQASVIITGESGTGKELVARAVHDMSERHGKPFVTVNCGAIPENLIESEFFGHLKGAFSGAHADRPGFLDAADGGTLFLDEIGEMPLPFQVKLLRALDGKGYTPVGDHRVRQSDFRLISATNRNLEMLVQSKRMREDFYYRINTVPIELPPLRERKEDLPLLIDHLLAKYSEEQGRTLEMPPEVRYKLIKHHWPGNVRELQNVLSRYFTLKEIELEPTPLVEPEPAPEVTGEPDDPISAEDFFGRLSEVERSMLMAALGRNRWNVGHTAQALGVSRRTLQRRIRKYGLK